MTKERFKEIIDGMNSSRELFQNSKYDEAQNSIDSLIDSLTSEELKEDDDEYKYVDFKTAIEEGIYRMEAQKYGDEIDKELKLIDFPISNMYVLSGSIALQRQDYGHALEQLENAMDWNPINPEIAFEYAEVVKRMGSVDQFFDLTKRIFPHIYTPGQLAHAYRNAAYYLESKKQNEKALAMLVFSQNFEKSESAKREMYALMKDAGEEHKQISSDEVRDVCKEIDIPFGPDMDVVHMAAGNGQYFAEQNNYKMAQYFVSIAYNLTRDPNLKEILNNISKKLEDNKTE